MDLSTLTAASLTDMFNQTFGKAVKVGTYPKSKMISGLEAHAAKFDPARPEEPEVETTPILNFNADARFEEESAHMADDMGPLFPTEVEDPADLALDPVHPEEARPTTEVTPEPVNPLTFEEAPGGVGYPAPEPTTDEEALLADRLAKGECPFCGGDPANQTAAGEEGTFLGDSCNYCHTCDKTYNAITGVEVPTRDVKKRRILNPQGKIDAKGEALAAANFSLTYDRNSRLWTVASRVETEKNLWNMTSKEFAGYSPKEIVASAEARLRAQA